MDLLSKKLELTGKPLKLVNLGGKKVMVLYQNLKVNSLILTDYGQIAELGIQTIVSGMDQIGGGRHMDADSLNDPLDNKYAPLLAILYDERKIDILRGADYLTKES